MSETKGKAHIHIEQEYELIVDKTCTMQSKDNFQITSEKELLGVGNSKIGLTSGTATIEMKSSGVIHIN